MRKTSDKDYKDDNYINENLSKIAQGGINKAIQLAIPIFLLFLITDFYLKPGAFKTLFLYRIVISLVLLILFIMNRYKRSMTYQFTLAVITVIVCAVAIEVLSFHFTEHRYFYYAGMNLVVIAALGFVPAGPAFSLLFILLVYSIFLVPFIVFNRMPEPIPFALVNIYLFSTCVIAFIWRNNGQKDLLQLLKLQYATIQEKNKVADHANHLEEVVDGQSRTIKKTDIILSNLVENAKDGIVILDHNGVVTRANQSACNIYKKDKNQMTGINIMSLEEKHRQEWEKRLRHLLNGHSLIFEVEHHAGDGSRKKYEVNANGVDIENQYIIQMFYREITERENLHQQIMQAQKMEALGALACGVAHDFRNTLTTLYSFTDFISRLQQNCPECTSHGVLEKNVKIIQTELHQASELVKRLLSIGISDTEYEMVSLDLNEIIEKTAGLFAKILAENISLQTHLDYKISRITGNQTQIEQVLTNLILNAQQAMADGGIIVIHSDYVRDGKYVHISVSDTGKGILEKNLSRIFNPFFTTKKKEESSGSGLGLTMVYRIVKDHGGTITVDSKISQGTTFDMYFPAIKKADFKDEVWN